MLLDTRMLLRRADWVELIGRALGLRAAGAAQQPIASELGVPRSTVRGWLEGFAAVVERVRAHFTGWALFKDAGLSRIEPSGTPWGDAVAAIVAAVSAAKAVTVWEFVSAATGGRLLCNTSAPWPAPWLS